MGHRHYRQPRMLSALKTTEDGEITARKHFITGLARLHATNGVARWDTLSERITSSTFDPLATIFLAGAPVQTLDTIARLCATPVPIPYILRLPAELRLRIYDFVIEDAWSPWSPALLLATQANNHATVRGRTSRIRTIADDHDLPLEPSVLRVCKLFRKEGIDVYHRALLEEETRASESELREPAEGPGSVEWAYSLARCHAATPACESCLAAEQTKKEIRAAARKRRNVRAELRRLRGLDGLERL